MEGGAGRPGRALCPCARVLQGTFRYGAAPLEETVMGGSLEPYQAVSVILWPQRAWGLALPCERADSDHDGCRFIARPGSQHLPGTSWRARLFSHSEL